MGSVRSRMLRATTTTTTTTVLLLLLQAPAYRLDPVRPQANSVLTDAAASLKDAMALDYDVLPMFKDITFMMESLVNLESTLTVDFRTTLGLLKNKATKYAGDMQ